MKKFSLLTLLVVLELTFAPLAFARGGGGGGHASSGGHSSFSSSRSSTSSKSSTSSSTSRTSSSVTKPVAPPSRPTTSTSTVKSATAPAKGFSSTGYKVGSGGYSPRFRGYSAPAGSTVYYRQSSAMDWLPWVYIFSHDSHREATVQQPDGQKKTVKEEGVDTMYVINWILAIVLTLGVIGLIVYLVNKYTKKKENSRYGSL